MIGNRLYCSMHTRTHTHTTDTFHSYVSIAHQIEWDGGFPRDCQCKEIPIIKIDDSNKNLLPFFCNLLFIFLLIPDYYCHTYTHTHTPPSLNQPKFGRILCCRQSERCLQPFFPFDYLWIRGRKKWTIQHELYREKKSICEKKWIFCAWWFWIFVPFPSYHSHSEHISNKCIVTISEGNCQNNAEFTFGSWWAKRQAQQQQPPPPQHCFIVHCKRNSSIKRRLFHFWRTFLGPKIDWKCEYFYCHICGTIQINQPAFE